MLQLWQRLSAVEFKGSVRQNSSPAHNMQNIELVTAYVQGAAAMALLPVHLQVVPVYSISDSEDWRIRGYTKCPAYQTRLAAWLKSDAFRQKEQETQQLRQKVLLFRTCQSALNTR